LELPEIPSTALFSLGYALPGLSLLHQTRGRANNVLRFAANLREAAHIRIYFASWQKPRKLAKPMLISYARVSTEDQNLELQLSALRKAECILLF